jgi:hypothetical protein
MKNWILIVVMILAAGAGFNAHAQGPMQRNRQIRGPMLEKVRAAKWAFIIYKLDLDEKRANQLLPVYQAYEKEKMAIFRASSKELLLDDTELTDEQAEQLMNARMNNAQKMLDLKEKYKPEFLKVLSATELLTLQRAELQFAMKIQMERQKRRRNR